MKIFKIKQNVLFLSIALLSIACVGCEDVIQVDLNNTDPKLVIDATLTDDPPLATVIITESTDFYEPSEFELISGATVRLREYIDDELNREYQLDEIMPGIYADTIEIADGDMVTYTAEVILDDVTYTASATKPQSLPIDSVATEFQEGGGFGSLEDEGYRLHVYFNDNPGPTDYGRIKLIKNDTLITEYFLFDGEFTDGNPINYEYFFEVFQPGDTVNITLYAMDETVYDYFFTLINVVATGDGGTGAVPANPNTNWDNDALGYFGVFRTSYATIIVEEEP